MAWLTGWQYRRKFTVDADNIDSALTHFPITLFLNNSAGITDADITDIFDELGASSKKIAITKDDGTTQIYAEIELWDNANEQAVIHCSISDLAISDSTDTELYLYYDSTEDDNTTYIGDTPGSSPVTNVWDSSFKAVYHMKDATTSTVKDSTSNADTGNKQAANEPVVGTSAAGYQQTFDGSNDKIICTNAAYLDFATNDELTMTARIQFKNFSSSVSTIVCGRGDRYTGWQVLRSPYSRGLPRFRGDSGEGSPSTGAMSDNIIYTFQYFQNASTGSFVLNGTEHTLYKRGFSAITAPFIIGYSNASAHGHFNGIMYELRISSGGRALAWLKAEHHSLNDSLYTWSDVEEEPTVTQISVSDTGAGISVLSLLNSLSVSDVGALLQEILSIINSAAITDTGSDTENLSIINSMTAISDTAAALDVLSALAVYLQIADTTEGTENLSTLPVYSLNDSGTGIDTGAVVAIAALTEDGSGADTLIVTNFIPTQSDSGTTTDTLSSIRAVLSITDMGADTDSIKQITVVAASSDSGVNAGEGAFIINAMPLQTDSGTLLSESLTLFVRTLLTEYSTASDDDIKNIITNFSLSDSADGLEALLRTIYVDIIYGISKINITESLTSTLPTDPVYGISNVDTSVSTDSDFGSL